MRVLATKRDPSTGTEGADAVYGNDRLHELLGQADIVAAHLPVDAGDREPDRRPGACRHAPDGASDQCGARPGRRRGGADGGAAGEAHRRGRAGRHARGAAAGGLAAVGHAQCAAHAAHGRRDAALRGCRHRHPAGEPRPALARREHAQEPGGLPWFDKLTTRWACRLPKKTALSRDSWRTGRAGWKRSR